MTSTAIKAFEALVICGLFLRLDGQMDSETIELEEKVKHELGIVSADYREPGQSLVERLSGLGDRQTIGHSLIDLVEKYNEDGPNGANYKYFVAAIGALMTFGDRKAIPVLRSIALSSLYPSTSEVKSYVIKAIGEIDAEGNRELLLETLHDPEYPNRSAAAAGLSRIK